MVPTERRSQGDVHEDTARLQESSGRRELAPVHRSVPDAAQRETHGHVRDIDITTSLW